MRRRDRARGGGFGAKVVMTSAGHERASDRVAEAAPAIAADIVVMIQGDEPMIRPEMISAAVAPLLPDPIASLAPTSPPPSATEEELRDPNTIKIVMSRDGRALYFSRQPIPTRAARHSSRGDWLKQVCVIPFRRDGLRTFRALRAGRLEKAESIDMLRFLENGIPVHVVRTEFVTYAVDTPEDLERVAA